MDHSTRSPLGQTMPGPSHLLMAQPVAYTNAAAPPTSRPSENALSMLWQHYHRRNCRRDKTYSTLCAVLLCAVLLYHCSIAWRALSTAPTLPAGYALSELRTSAVASVCWVLAHVLMEAAFAHMTAGRLYTRHRAKCLMVARTGEPTMHS